MWNTKLKTIATILVTTAAVTSGGMLAQPPLAPKSADSPEMVQTEAKLAKLRELIRPQPGEHVTNMAKIAWERDPWVAAVKAGKEGKPVLIYAEGAAGIACGYG